VTLRPEEINRLPSGAVDGCGWHLRFKGVYGGGIYGSVITDQRGHGLYLLGDSDYPGVPGYEQRMTCLIHPDDFRVDPSAEPLDARETITSALVALGWGPRVGDLSKPWRCDV
jgi:hypothetical protein